MGALIHPEVIFRHSPYLEEDLASKDFLWCSRRVSPVHAEVVGGLRLPGRACHVDSASGSNGLGMRRSHYAFDNVHTCQESHTHTSLRPRTMYTPSTSFTPSTDNWTAPTPASPLITPHPLVHGRRAVSVRCLHHWMLFEDTMAVESFLERYRTQVEEVGSV